MNLKLNKHKLISFNTTTMRSLGFIIVATSPPPPTPSPYKMGGGVEWVQNFLLEKGDKRVKGLG